jgi:hypothetical protein
MGRILDTTPFTRSPSWASDYQQKVTVALPFRSYVPIQMVVSVCGYENGDFTFSSINTGVMNSRGQLPVSDSTARRGGKSKARRRSRPRKQSSTNTYTNDEPKLAPPGSLTRTKTLLLAALRVWELKHRIGD